MRAFLGWLRGEADHCSMAAIPRLEEEDRKRPNREHQKPSGEKTRIINRVKGTLARLGIRNFNGHLRYAAARLKQVRTPEGVAIPPNTMAELERDGGAGTRSCAAPVYPRTVSRDREDSRDQAE
jgi:transposase